MSSSQSDEELVNEDTYMKLDAAPEKHDAPLSILHAIIFVIAGTSQLWFWNALLNWIFDVRDFKFPDRRALTDTLTAVNTFGNLSAACMTVWRGGLSLKLCIFAGCLLIVSSIGVCLLLQYGDNDQKTILGLHFIVLIGGAGIGCVQSVEYAVASSIAPGYSGFVSIGAGICGILTFIIWLSCSHGAYKNAPTSSVWWIMMVGVGLILVTIVAINYLAKQPEVSRKLDEMRQMVRQERKNPDAPSYWQLFKKSWVYCGNVFFAFAVTLFIFPNIGPGRWGLESKEVTILIGMFQIGDFIGRSIPSLAPYAPIIQIKGTVLSTLNAFRLIFVVLYIIAWRRPSAMWKSMGTGVILLLALAITNGYYGTCALIEAPATIADDRYKGKASSMAVVFLLVGINAGLWLARLVTYCVEGQ